jgi:septal ring factor EnvC (AmiA/AmiB activator)
MGITKHLLRIGLCAVLLLMPVGQGTLGRAASIDDLERQRKALEQKAKEAEKQRKQQESTAAKAAEKIENVEAQIKELQGVIETTERSITDTQNGIQQQNQELARLESELRRIKDQQDALVRQMYILRQSAPDTLLYFSDEPVSKREQRQAQLSALKKSVTALYNKTQTAKEMVEKTRYSLVEKNDQLERLKTQQDEQRRGLANYRYAQVLLKANAEEAAEELEEQSRQYRSQAAKIDQQISAALTAIIRARNQGTFTGGAGVGQRVSRGDFVGYQGNTGYSFGDHVHFEVRVNGAPVNPMPYFEDGTLSYPLASFRITQGFGRTPYGYLYASGYHSGVDLAGPIGSPVYAPADGVVVLNQDFGEGYTYGKAWAMQLDNGIYVLMGHLRR